MLYTTYRVAGGLCVKPEEGDVVTERGGCANLERVRDEVVLFREGGERGEN